MGVADGYPPRVQLNQIIRVAASPGHAPVTEPFDQDGNVNFFHLLSNSGMYTPGNIQRPMFHHKPIKREGEDCYPAMYFHSNPYKTDRSVKPWTDILLPDEGYVYYNGDNQTPGLPPTGKRNSGNSTMEKIWPEYQSKEREIRERAAPILVFEQVKYGKDGKIKGYRAFRGYGIISKIEIRQEYEPKTERVFSNYLFEVSLFKVPPGGLDWSWIYDRRNPNLSVSEINKKAPKAWKDWVKNGYAAIEKSRQRILHYKVSKPKEQVEELKPAHRKILDKIVSHYPKSTDKGRFEALASLVAQEYFGEKNYLRGWITKHSGDMGVDFIGRLKITNEAAPNPPGTVLGFSKLLVIGQAKCRTKYDSNSAAEDAKDIARVAARLQRGYLGVYITTGTFKESTQKEVSIDGYPIVLINGRQMADLLIQHNSRNEISMDKILSECDKWYYENKSDEPPLNILRRE